MDSPEERAFIKARLRVPCPPEKAFWLHGDSTLTTPYHLVASLEKMDDECFTYHVNADRNKNDFADWIRDVFEDAELARRLEGVLDRKAYHDILVKRLEELEHS